MSTGLTRRGRRKLHAERERLEEESEETTELNLVPYLDIVTNILMFLIVTITTMLTVGNIEVLVPEYSQSQSVSQKKSDKDKPPLNLTVTITGKGFTVATSTGVLFENNVPDKLPTVPKNATGRYDFEGLQKVLVNLKRQNDKEQQAILAANPDIQYETIIGTMDVLRAGPDLKPLFPMVLFSTGIQ
jgi:biopolymer transport protein TolR